MSSRVACDQGHWGGLCRDAAIEFSKQGNLGPCRQVTCQSPRRYIVSHYFANIAESHEHELEAVARLYTDQEANDEGYDPMLFLLRNRRSGQKLVWPFYWGKDRNGRWHVGQFPPLVALDDLKKMIAILEDAAINSHSKDFSK